MPIELIGEEIYDEFDSEGAYGDRYPYESSDNAQDRDGSNPAAPYRLSAISDQQPQSTMGSNNQWNSQAKPPATASTGHKPASLKGLGFVRTRSAPPVPREMETDNFTGTEWKMQEYDEKDSVRTFPESDPGHTFLGAAIQMPKPIKGTGRYPPSVILERHSTISSYDSCEVVPATVVSLEGKGWTLPPTQQNLMATAPASARLMPSVSLLGPQLSAIQPTPTPTGTPPASLEAILFERKRRLTANNPSNSSTPVHFGPPSVSPSPAPSASSFGFIHKDPGVSGGPAISSTTSGGGAPLILRGVHCSSGKGTMFKSSPLGGGDRVGVVVAERAKAARQSEDVQGPGQEQEED